MVANPGSALGEAIGKLLENAIVEGIRPEIEKRNCSVHAEKMKNGSGNTYQIDAVIFDSRNNPVVIIDPKYIRYTKHNRDKGSWLCVAHYNLRKSHPTIRKSIAVLAGRWSKPSKALIKSFGIEIIEAPFQAMVETLQKWDIDFAWAESDRASASKAWEKYSALSLKDRNDIASELSKDVVKLLKKDIAKESLNKFLFVSYN